MKQLGGSGDVYAGGIAVNPDGDSYIVGYTNAKLGTAALGGNDAYIAKYDTSGNQVWVQQFGTTADDRSVAVAVDIHGNTFVAGQTTGAFPGQSNCGNTFVFVAEYNPSGTQVWLQEFTSYNFLGGKNNDIPTAIAVDSNSDSYVLDNTNNITKFDKNGNQLWQIGTTGGGDGIAVGASGNVYVTGSFGTPVDDKAQGIVYSGTTGNLYSTGSTLGSLGATSAGGVDTFVAKDGPTLTNDVVYRFYNSQTQQHFYTANTAERDMLKNTPSIGYSFEGGAFGASLSTGPGLLPLYRFYAGASQDHFYTTSESEKNSLISNTKSGYGFEGVAFYVYGAGSSADSNVNRYYNAKIGQHLFTGNTSEIAGLSKDWVSEGVAFKASL